MQRKEDKRLLPYMIGAFVLIVAAAVVAGVLVGGFTMYMLIPLGVVLGALVAFIIFGRRAQKSVYQQGRGPDRRGGLGAGQPARQMAGHPGRRRHRPLRRGAPGDRPARRDLRRRGLRRRGSSRCWRRRRSAPRGSSATSRSTTSIVGNGEGEVPLAKLERHLTKLPANITVKQMDSLESRLAALGSQAGTGRDAEGPAARAGEDARRCQR